MSETYISIDIEADGPIPGRNSMLSFGAVAYDEIGDEIDTYEANLDTLDEATPSASTMDWWAAQPEAWEACRKDTRPAEEVLPEFLKWVSKFKRPVIVGYPVTFDFLFLYWYTMAFGGIEDGGRCPFGFSGLDIKTLAMASMGTDYRRSTKRNMPKAWFHGAPKHNHEALTDARGQGLLFFNILDSLKR